MKINLSEEKIIFLLDSGLSFCFEQVFFAHLQNLILLTGHELWVILSTHAKKKSIWSFFLRRKKFFKMRPLSLMHTTFEFLSPLSPDYRPRTALRMQFYMPIESSYPILLKSNSKKANYSIIGWPKKLMYFSYMCKLQKYVSLNFD